MPDPTPAAPITRIAIERVTERLAGVILNTDGFYSHEGALRAALENLGLDPVSEPATVGSIDRDAYAQALARQLSDSFRFCHECGCQATAKYAPGAEQDVCIFPSGRPCSWFGPRICSMCALVRGRRHYDATVAAMEAEREGLSPAERARLPWGGAP